MVSKSFSDKQEASQSTKILLIGIWRHLSHRRRTQLGCLLFVMIASGVAELVSLSAVLPFLTVLTDPELLWQQTWINSLFIRFGLSQSHHLVLLVTGLFALTAVLAAAIRLFNLWLNGRLVAAVGSDLSCEAYLRTLHQPYFVHVQRNSADVITATTTQISRTVVALTSLLQLVTASFVAVALLAGLLLIDWGIALATAVLFGTVYGLLALRVRRELLLSGKKWSSAARQQLKAVQEGLGAIRDILLESNQNIYLDIYETVDRPLRLLQSKNQFLSSSPRYAVEALSLVAIALTGCLLVLQKGSESMVIPLLGSLALGAQRLLPALQQIYTNWSSLKVYNADMQAVLALLNQPLAANVSTQKTLPLESNIFLDRVSFRYGQDQPVVLVGLNLEIHRGERIGLIGSTGSGKSTMVDLLMGLLKPSDGRLLVNGEDVHDPSHPERLLSWRKAIAHVPQNIYLADTSFAENIAFGVPKHKIDFAKVRLAAQQSQIAAFIESSPKGYSSHVGERGVRLSGGQRQRIGIARALYKQASVLVLDEATSALDNKTEEAVMTSVDDLDRNLTIIMIAHRLTTINRCDRVLRLHNGLIVSSGPPCKFS